MSDPALKEKNNQNKTISNQILHILSLIPNKTEALDFSLLDFKFISNYFQLNEASAKEFLLQNSKRADFLFNLLRQCKDKNVFLGKKYYFVKKNVSDNDLRSFIMYSLLAEKTFGIRAEFLLAIAAQESNYNKNAYSSGQHGPFQFTNSTINDLLKRQNHLKTLFSKNFSDKPMLLNALNKSFDLLKDKNNLYNINNAVYLAASLIRIKAMERKIPLDNLKRLAKAYNGGGTKNYSEDVYLRYLFLTGQQQGKIVFFEFQK